MECKDWLDLENFDPDVAFAFNMSPKDKRQLRKIINENCEYIEQKWDAFQGRHLICR